MKPDDFEQQLQRQPLRLVPPDWRAEILAAARAGAAPPAPVSAPRASFLSTLPRRLSAWLWPHPAAWAGLAAVWIFVFAVDFSIRGPAPVVAQKSAPPSPAVIVQLRLQQRMLAELIGAREPGDADRSKLSAPPPRSERVEILMT